MAQHPELHNRNTRYTFIVICHFKKGGRMVHYVSAPAMVDILVQYLAEESPKLADQYRWKIPADCPVELEAKADDPLSIKNIELKRALSIAWELNIENRSDLAKWFVSSWGGIRRNAEETFLSYINASDNELAFGPIKGIASWSKILAMRRPDTFAIFDSRVSTSLNALQLLNKDMLNPCLFPNIANRNNQIKKFQAWMKTSSKVATMQRIEPDTAYRYYLELLGESSQALGPDCLAIAEMTLFANAEQLAALALAAHAH